MTLSLYNTLTRQKESFTSIEPNQVQMYCCGITVYDYCHLGHARTCVIWDLVRKYLEWRGYQVKYVQNFTDIDDKILNRANKDNTSMIEVSERFIAAYFEDMERLHVRKADLYPRATHTLNGIQCLVCELEEKGFAYFSQGDVYYSVRKFTEYGKLSGRKLEDLIVGASGRVDAEDPESKKKKDPFDFALWKAAKPNEPFWESKWGNGRPGWHIECSAMVREHLGETIDIHVGGSDLVFPHHENEIAQSEAVTNKPLARYWMHNGMVKVGGEKMSKSLGNFITIRELLDKYDPMAVRLFILQAQYRKPLDFTDEALQASTNGWATLREGLLFGEQYGKQLGWTGENKLIDAFVDRFNEAVDDDFNFAGGLAILFELAKEIRKERNLFVHQGNIEISSESLEGKWQTLVKLSEVLGLEVLEKQLSATFPTEEESLGVEQYSLRLSNEQIESLIQQRTEARKNKNFAEGDRIRDELKSHDVILIDQPGGLTKWHRE